MKRDTHIDAIKGLGMICVVFGHCGFPWAKYLFLFHMPVFIMASGYCYSIKHSYSILSLKSYIGKIVYALFTICGICGIP